MEPLHEIAHISHAELLTPRADESLRFFVDVLGMEEEAREGQSVYLRGWGDYQPYSLKLTESASSGLAWLGLRAASPEALERRVAAAEERFAGGAVPRPEHWGGFLLEPSEVEFWQGRHSRLHDRLRYRRADGGWTLERLAP